MKPDIKQLIEAVREWGRDKGITGPNGRGTLLGQLSKTQEELNETRDAAAALVYSDLLAPDYADPIHDALVDGLGDIMVELILAAELADVNIETCLQVAYDARTRHGN